MVNITTGGAATMTVEERLKPCAVFKPEVASLNMGSMNFGLYPMLARYKEFQHDWERPYLEGSRDRVFKNTFADIERILTTCADNGTRFEIECYDIGHLYTLAHFVDRGLVKAPFFVQSVFGILGGIGAHPEDVMHMRRTADRLFGKDYHWSVLGAGRNQMTVAAQAIALGGNIRVGLEDSLWLGPGKLAETNAQQVAKAKRLVEEFGEAAGAPEISGAGIRRVDRHLRRDEHGVEPGRRHLMRRALAAHHVARERGVVAVEIDDDHARRVRVELGRGGDQHIA